MNHMVGDACASARRATAWLRTIVTTFVAATALLVSVAGAVRADPATDALDRLAELSRQAERTNEQIYSAQMDLDNRLAEERVALDKLADDRLIAAAARTDLQATQLTVDRLAASLYMGGRTDALSTFLTADSPNALIGTLADQRILSLQMAESMAALRIADDAATSAEEVSEQSAENARTLADQAAQVRADLENKRVRLTTEIASVQAQYDALTNEQRALLADPGPPPPEVLSLPVDPSESAAAPSPSGSGVVQAALTRVGAPYQWGASGPDAFDCSGLIQWSFLQSGRTLPRSSQALAEGGQPVAIPDLQPGDIVTFYSDASHAGIYIGDGLMVHSSTYGVPVKVAPISSAPIYNARRY